MAMRDCTLIKVHKGGATLKKTHIFKLLLTILNFLAMFNLLVSLTHEQLFWSLLASISLIILSLAYFIIWLDKVMQIDPNKRNTTLIMFWLYIQIILFAIELDCAIYCINHA
jgi:lipid-A-disaccharide synthase-like uncharacterized protein